MKVKYKVVHKRDRGSIYARCKDYIKYYKPDSIVKEVKGSLGIMVFKTRSAAEYFINNSNKEHESQIIKVLPIGKAKICYQDICDIPNNGRRMKRFYKLFNLVQKYRNEGNEELTKKYGNILYDVINIPPRDTQMYPAVKVLE